MIDLKTAFASVVAATALKNDKPRMRVYMGATVTNEMLGKALGIEPPEPAPVVERKRLNLTSIKLVPGMTCPRCLGTGRSEWGGCHWCTHPSKPKATWGLLSARDIGLINARMNSGRPVCDVIAA